MFMFFHMLLVSRGLDIRWCQVNFSAKSLSACHILFSFGSMVWIAQNFAPVLRVVLGHADKSTERQEANEEKAAAAGWSWREQRIAGNTDMYSNSNCNTRKAKTGNSHSASSNYPAMPSG